MAATAKHTLDHVFHALADPTRRALLRAAGDGGKTVGELAGPFRMSLAAVSKHVKVLEAAGLIRREHRGTACVIHLEPKPLREAAHWLSHYETYWNERLDALDALLTEDAMNDTLTISLTRVFKASRAKVFAAWTDPATLVRWISPGHLDVGGAQLDVRPGGSFRIDMSGELGGQDITGHAFGVYTDVQPDSRLCFTWTWHYAATGQTSEETLVTVELADVPEGTELRLTHEKFVTPQAHEGYRLGWLHCLETLDAVLRG